MLNPICPLCMTTREPIFEMGRAKAVAWVPRCDCPLLILDPGVSDDEFEKYRQKILATLP